MFPTIKLYLDGRYYASTNQHRTLESAKKIVMIREYITPKQGKRITAAYK